MLSASPSDESPACARRRIALARAWSNFKTFEAPVELNRRAIGRVTSPDEDGGFGMSPSRGRSSNIWSGELPDPSMSDFTIEEGSPWRRELGMSAMSVTGTAGTGEESTERVEVNKRATRLRRDIVGGVRTRGYGADGRRGIRGAREADTHFYKVSAIRVLCSQLHVCFTCQPPPVDRRQPHRRSR